MPNATATSIILNAEAYVAAGPWGPGVSPAAWAARFAELGGTSCTVTPSWTYGLPTGDLFLFAEGTPEAVAFVEQTVVG